VCLLRFGVLDGGTQKGPDFPPPYRMFVRASAWVFLCLLRFLCFVLFISVFCCSSFRPLFLCSFCFQSHAYVATVRVGQWVGGWCVLMCAVVLFVSCCAVCVLFGAVCF
jgi:hypothetical protein